MSNKSDVTGRILVVDDNEQNRLVAEGYLVGAGHEVILARDGIEGLELFARCRPDLVLLDVLMPKLDGYATCRRLRALPGGDRVPVLFLTALSGQEEQDKAVSSGGDDFLTKPINRVALLLRVRSLLRLRDATERLVTSSETIREQRDELLLAHARREQLLSMIVNDLKDPLTGVLMNGDFLLESPDLPSTEREAVRDMVGSCAELDRLITNLRHVARSGARRVEARLRTVELDRLISRVVRSIRRHGIENDVSIRVSIQTSRLRIMADADLLERTLDNLLKNAINYSPPHGVVDVTVTEGADDRIVISVEDQGPGIPEEARDEIFSPQFQRGGGHSTEHSKPGFGLAYCRLAAEAHGGFIDLVDGSSSGARFEVELPRRQLHPDGDELGSIADGFRPDERFAVVESVDAEVETEVEDEAASSEEGEEALDPAADERQPRRFDVTESGTPRIPGRVAIVDGDPQMLSTFRRILRRDGNTVTVCDTAEQLLDYFDSDPADVVVSEVQLPGMSGLSLMRELRKKSPDVPVILTASNPDVDTAVAAMENGALKFLVKPIDVSSLSRSVRRAIHLGRLASIKREMRAHRVDDEVPSTDPQALEKSLDNALDTMWIAWQAIVRMPAREVFAYEALMRSDEPSLPHPGAVLDAAERLSRLHDIGRTMRRLAAQEAPNCPMKTHMFLNIHPNDLNDPDLLRDDAGLNGLACRVVFEITERAGIDSLGEYVIEVVGQARNRGYRIAVDDLGSGYAGLTSFARLGPEIVKLDMSLVRGVNTDPTRQRLIRSMIDLCEDLGIDLISEGVETDEELECLTSLGCELFQGYLFQRPDRGFRDPFAVSSPGASASRAIGD